MYIRRFAFWAFFLAPAAAFAGPQPAASAVKLVRKDADRRVGGLVGGQAFPYDTYPAEQPKPALFPLRSAAGHIVTRGYPLEPRPGEVTDHPHHTGFWFNYGDVNGVHFWENSEQYRKSNPKDPVGNIVHKGIKAA